MCWYSMITLKNLYFNIFITKLQIQLQKFIKGEQHPVTNIPRWVWTNLWGGEVVSFHLWGKHLRLKSQQISSSLSVCVIEPSEHESSTRRDRKKAKQSSLLIYVNSCDHMYKHTLLLHWWLLLQLYTLQAHTLLEPCVDVI